MKKCLVLIFLLVSGFLFATDYAATNVIGNVTYLVDGVETPVVEGQILSDDDVISVGLNSRLALKADRRYSIRAMQKHVTVAEAIKNSVQVVRSGAAAVEVPKAKSRNTKIITGATARGNYQGNENDLVEDDEL